MLSKESGLQALGFGLWGLGQVLRGVLRFQDSGLAKA